MAKCDKISKYSKVMKTIKKRDFKRNGNFWVYIVECANGTYYTGYTNNLERRITEHNNSCGRGAKYLKGKTPVKLMYTKKYSYYRNAVRAEKDMKKRARKEKEAMIKGYWNSLSPQICQLTADKSKRGDDNQRCEA